MSRRILVYVLVLVVFAGVGVVLVLVNNSGGVTLDNRFDESQAFTFAYPDEWIYRIPLANFLILAPLPVLDGAEPGPSFTVQRGTRFEAGGETPQDALQIYIERNPLSDDNPGDWTIIDPLDTITLDGRAAAVVELRGSDDTSQPDQRVQIVSTLADNGMVYFLTISAPESLWDDFAPALTAILESVTLLE